MARAEVLTGVTGLMAKEQKGPDIKCLVMMWPVAENDILRDEGEAFGRKLSAAGVTVTTVRYNGMIHDWGMLNGLAEEPATKSLVRHAASELRHYLK